MRTNPRIPPLPSRSYLFRGFQPAPSPSSRFISLLLQSAQTLRTRGSSKQNQKKQKNGSDRKRGEKPRYRKTESASRRHGVLPHISSAVSPPSPRSSQWNIF